jgi:hypothetical protein
MTEYTYEQLREQRGFGLLKKDVILRWQGRRDLIIDECNSQEYPLTALRRIGEQSGIVSFQVVHYRVEPTFKDDLLFYFGKVIRARDNEFLYARTEKKMAQAVITNQTETLSIQDDWRRAKAELNLIDILNSP